MQKPLVSFFFSILFAVFSISSTYAENETLIVAGGCFWCVESDFEKHKGVLSAVSGYTGGVTENPTYKEVTYNNTGHFEAVKVTYDPKQVSLQDLVDYYWKTIDPTDGIGQFCDKGPSYKAALFYQNETQEKVFEASLVALQKNKPFKGKIVTEILPANIFYIAEDYHQNYYKKNSLRYQFYRSGCGRDKRIKKLWGAVASQH